jgi:hypothetical protein
LGNASNVWQKQKSPNGNDCCFAHLGTEFESSSAFALHCSGGGVDENGAWKNIKNDGKFLFSVKALSKVFRAKFCEKLKANLKDKFNENQENEYEKIRQSLWEKPWVVYAKKPFGSPKSVVEYLGRYTHKIAISNGRIRN